MIYFLHECIRKGTRLCVMRSIAGIGKVTLYVMRSIAGIGKVTLLCNAWNCTVVSASLHTIISNSKCKMYILFYSLIPRSRTSSN